MRTIKNSQNHLRPVGRVLTFVKHQICSPSCRSRLNEHLSFNMIENLLCLGFISLYLWFCFVLSLNALDIYARHFEYYCMRCLCSTENNWRKNVQRQQFSFKSKVSLKIMSQVSISLHKPKTMQIYVYSVSQLPGVCYYVCYTSR